MCIRDSVEADGDVDSTPAGTNVDGSSKVVQDATLEIDGKTFTIRELASQEMKNAAGATDVYKRQVLHGHGTGRRYHVKRIY